MNDNKDEMTNEELRNKISNDVVGLVSAMCMVGAVVVYGVEGDISAFTFLIFWGIVFQVAMWVDVFKQAHD